MSKKSKATELTKELMKECDIKDVAELQSVLNQILKNDVEALLEAVLDKELGVF